MLGQGKSVISPLPQEKRTAEAMCDELTTIATPYTPALLVGRMERIWE